ncbi:MAG: DUF21 domain-containing protein [Planctomycetes bacterium]|nr:DUF21 domain-containing protein [Planctomycetota bacterium]
MSGAAGLALTLLLISATFSGAEAALFTLSGRPRGSAPWVARSLLKDPAGSLSVILLGNLLVNLAYYASTAAWAAGQGAGAAAALSAAGVLILVLLGEILPKLLAHRSPVPAARLMLPPVWLLHAVLGFPARWLGARLFRQAVHAVPVAAEELDSLLEAEGDRLLPREERSLLRQILELDILRAGAVRRPLSETPKVQAGQTLESAVQGLREQRAAWAAGVEDDGEIRGVLDLTRLPVGRLVRDAMQPVPVLPEVAPLARGVGLLRRRGLPFVLLVDEYGAPAGILERGRWADTLLDRVPEETDTGRSAIQRLSPNRFEVDGGLPLHIFRERFGDPGPVDAKLDTLGGLLAERLGRLPEVGDRLALTLRGGGWLELEVLRLEELRAAAIRVTVRPEREGHGA